MAVLAREIVVLRARLEERNIRSARERILHHLAIAPAREGDAPQDGALRMAPGVIVQSKGDVVRRRSYV